MFMRSGGICHGEYPLRRRWRITGKTANQHCNPDLAFEISRLPTDGVGLARLEFIIANSIGFHPRCALDYANLTPDMQKQVRKLADGYDSPRQCYVDKIAEGVATIAAAFSPRSVIVRLSDLNPMNTPVLWAAKNLNPWKKTPCWAFAALRVILIKHSPIVLPWSVKPFGGCAKKWA